MAHLLNARATEQVAYDLLPPPYTEFISPNGTDPLRSVPHAGVLLALRPHYGASDAEVMQAIDVIHGGSPRTTAILWLDLVGREAAVRLAAAASARGVRGIVPSGAPDPARLREELTNAELLPGDVVRWLERRGVVVSRALGDMIDATVRHAIDCRTIASLDAREGGSTRGWRTAVRQSGLGTTQGLHQGIRLLALGVSIQRETGRAIESIALEAGYVSAAALRQRFNEVVGYPPSEIRRLLGWEWILERALRRGGWRPRG